MARTSFLSLVFLLSYALALGQQESIQRNGDTASLTQVVGLGTDCPVGVEASVVGLPSKLSAGPSINGQAIQPGEPSAPGQQPVPNVLPPTDSLVVHLYVNNPSPRDIVGASFTVRGFSRKLRVISPYDPSNTPDLWRTVDVELNVQAKRAASHYLSVDHFKAILNSLDLDSVTYADGSQWRAASSGSCRIRPSAVVRIVGPTISFSAQ